MLSIKRLKENSPQEVQKLYVDPKIYCLVTWQIEFDPCPPDIQDIEHELHFSELLHTRKLKRYGMFKSAGWTSEYSFTFTKEKMLSISVIF